MVSNRTEIEILFRPSAILERTNISLQICTVMKLMAVQVINWSLKCDWLVQLSAPDSEQATVVTASLKLPKLNGCANTPLLNVVLGS